MAEAVFRHKVTQAGLSDKIEVDGAGTGDWHIGNPPHEGTRGILDKAGISYEGMTARQMTKADLDFDYILTMDASNLRNVRTLGSGRGEVRPFMDFAPHTGVTEVPDPYYTGGYEEVYALVNAACDGLLQYIKTEHRLG
jgi:protein-tyrosine phosphatase